MNWTSQIHAVRNTILWPFTHLCLAFGISQRNVHPNDFGRTNNTVLALFLLRINDGRLGHKDHVQLSFGVQKSCVL